MEPNLTDEEKEKQRVAEIDKQIEEKQKLLDEKQANADKFKEDNNLNGFVGGVKRFFTESPTETNWKALQAEADALKKEIEELRSQKGGAGKTLVSSYLAGSSSMPGQNPHSAVTTATANSSPDEQATEGDVQNDVVTPEGKIRRNEEGDKINSEEKVVEKKQNKETPTGAAITGLSDKDKKEAEITAEIANEKDPDKAIGIWLEKRGDSSPETKALFLKFKSMTEEEFHQNAEANFDEALKALTAIFGDTGRARKWITDHFYKEHSFGEKEEDKLNEGFDTLSNNLSKIGDNIGRMLGLDRETEAMPSGPASGSSNEELLKQLDKKKGELSTFSQEDAEQLNNRVDETIKAMSNIDDGFIDSMPRFIWDAARQGEFGQLKIDPELQKKYDSIKEAEKEGKELDSDELKIKKEYDTQKEKVKDARGRLGYFIVNSIGTTLGNVARGMSGQAGKKTKYAEMRDSAFQAGLDRRNQKINDTVEEAMSLVKSTADNKQEVANTLEKAFSNEATRNIFSKLDLNNRQVIVDYITQLGRSIHISDILPLAAGSLVFQNTGEVAPMTKDILMKGGSAFMNGIKALIPGI